MSQLTNIPSGALTMRTPDEIRLSIMSHTQTAVQSIIGIGYDLMDAHAKLDHGEWLPWLKSLQISKSTANNYIRIAQRAENMPILYELPYTKAVALLSAPVELQEQLTEEGLDDKSAAEIKRLTKLWQEEKARADKAASVAAEEAKKRTEAVSLTERVQADLDSQLRKVKTLQANADNLIRQRDSQITKADVLHSQNMRLRHQLQTATKPETVTIEKEVIREVEVIPADYEDMKNDLKNLQEDLKAAQERVNAVPESDEPEQEIMSVYDAFNACTEFQQKCWSMQHLDFSLLDKSKRDSYMVPFRGVRALCERIMANLDKAAMIIEGGDACE